MKNHTCTIIHTHVHVCTCHHIRVRTSVPHMWYMISTYSACECLVLSLISAHSNQSTRHAKYVHTCPRVVSTPPPGQLLSQWPPVATDASVSSLGLRSLISSGHLLVEIRRDRVVYGLAACPFPQSSYVMWNSRKQIIHVPS